jgi:hypothetical protein
LNPPDHSFAIAPSEVAAVRLGVGRNARHAVILRGSGAEVPVSFGYAVRLFDRLHDRLIPRGWKVANSKPKRRAVR